MQVTVHYLAQLRRAAGCSSERLDVEPGLTLGELFRRVARTHDAAFRTLLLGENGKPHASLLVFVGEQPADLTGVLCDNDEVTILTPMAGGACP
jgi:molybdopterin converting factor small subunit